MPSSHLILCRPLLLLPPIPPSIRVFSNESTHSMRWPKYWSFSFSISPSNEHSGLISFRTDWLDLLAVQGTLKSLLQHHSSKASIFKRSAFFTVQLSHPILTWPQLLLVGNTKYSVPFYFSFVDYHYYHFQVFINYFFCKYLFVHYSIWMFNFILFIATFKCLVANRAGRA